ncbi:MAG: DUF1877 family protein [Spirochaetaceae bacterium]|jgi:hypothetical protein|nr:DUF1877 family protein [Spirochaetaceae bacterium]
MTPLEEFARQIREKTKELDAFSGKKALELQSKLSTYIAEQTQNLMNQGVSVAEIQDALRAAVDRVEQTYAPDIEEYDEETSERLEPPISVFTFFLPMEETEIAAFTAGELYASELMDHINTSQDITSLEMVKGLDLVLSDFGKNQALCDVFLNGEIVAGSNGEAFIPEELTVKNADGYQYSVNDPAVFKSVGEVQTTTTLLEPFDRKTFFKKANIKKLIKSGWLDDYAPRSVKKEADYIINELWQEFIALQEIYRKASEQRKGMFIFVGYQGEETDDFEEDF